MLKSRNTSSLEFIRWWFPSPFPTHRVLEFPQHIPLNEQFCWLHLNLHRTELNICLMHKWTAQQHSLSLCYFIFPNKPPRSCSATCISFWNAKYCSCKSTTAIECLLGRKFYTTKVKAYFITVTYIISFHPFERRFRHPTQQGLWCSSPLAYFVERCVSLPFPFLRFFSSPPGKCRNNIKQHPLVEGKAIRERYLPGLSNVSPPLTDMTK